MIRKHLVGVYSLTLLLSAFLLFGIQPLSGKMLLPLLGGSPAVWNTAMLFFQTFLLAGYAYAHLTSRFMSVKPQALLHIVLFAIAVTFLPPAINAAWLEKDIFSAPISWQIGVMAATIGMPLFVLAGCAPMLQRWFAHTDHSYSENPYFLYAASNLGSMSALLAYPFLIEPVFGLQTQTKLWAACFIILLVLIALTAFMTAKTLKRQEEAKPEDDEKISWRDRLIWLFLSFLPSSLMLGVTTYITTDIAAVPLLWIIPLALYVGTFILAFARSFALPLDHIKGLHSYMLIAVVYFFYLSTNHVKTLELATHMIFFFVSALLCHGHLARRKPHAGHLTEFYLIMSVGGVLGGIFNALIAPVLLTLPIEYGLVLALTVFVGLKLPETGWKFTKPDGGSLVSLSLCVLCLVAGGYAIYAWGNLELKFFCTAAMFVWLLLIREKPKYFALLVLALLLINPGYNFYRLKDSLHVSRNYFGVLNVTQFGGFTMRTLIHGTTIHGVQPQKPEYKTTPVSYYYNAAPIFASIEGKGPQKIAAIGMGVGSIACYKAPGRSINFYEIDEDVIRIASDPQYFTYLTDCGTPYTAILGDGRLKIEEAEDETYALVFLDAFTSDNIPVHLLTLEAFDTYFNKLQPGGFVAVHISNRYVDLESVLSSMAKETGRTVLFQRQDGKRLAAPDVDTFSSHYAVVGRTAEDLSYFTEKDGWYSYSGEEVSPWTDDYVNLVASMRIKSHQNSSN